MAAPALLALAVSPIIMETNSAPQSVSASPGARYHAFDKLRASMMLLGLVLHSAMSYIPTFFGKLAGWPYSDPNNSEFFLLLVEFIHTFRMPAFFLMSGFFGALLLERRGTGRFLRHRLNRILLPLAAAWILCWPVMAAIYRFAERFTAGGGKPGSGLRYADIADGLLLHLWFLYYLILFSFVMSGIVWLSTRAPTTLRRGVLDAFAGMMRRGWGLLMLALVSAFTIFPMHTMSFDTTANPVPVPRVFMAYFVFFAAGWLICRRLDLLEVLKRRGVTSLAAGVALYPAYVVLRHVAGTQGSPGFSDLERAVLAYVFAIKVWLIVLGLTGTFLKCLNDANTAWRYLSDASYWIYLSHFPIALLVPMSMHGLDISPFIKSPIALITVFAVTLLTYHFAVRSTLIGLRLNGRIYAKGTSA